MKTFRELISWELDQEKNQSKALQLSPDQPAGKLNSYMMRKMRHLNAARASAAAQAEARPA